jgi:hypothetical protein
MNQPMDSTQSIDIFFRRIDDCVHYAIDGKVAFTNEKILQTAYHAITSSGYYTDATTKEWRKKNGPKIVDEFQTILCHRIP